MKEKTPKRANKAIVLLDGLIEQLHYFYGDNPNFRRDVLTPAIEIENTLKDLAINKKETFKRISKKYEEYYKKKQEATDITIANVNDTQLNERIREKYRQNTKKN